MRRDENEIFGELVSSRMEGAVVKFAEGASKKWGDIYPKGVLGI